MSWVSRSRRWVGWVNLFKSRQDAGDGALSETERSELARLRKENSELKMDQVFLKTASLFFAQEVSDTNEKADSTVVATPR